MSAGKARDKRMTSGQNIGTPMYNNSTGFQTYKPKTEPFPRYLEPLLEECDACYQELLKWVI